MTLALSRGYDNPGPIAAFPPNRSLFPPAVSPGALSPGAHVLVPWHPNILRKLVATEEYLAVELAIYARELIEREGESREKFEKFLILIDTACMLTNVGKGIADLVVHGARHGEMTAAQLVTWFVESRLETFSDITTLAVPAPSAPKKDFRFFVRHTLGPWTPSFWAAAVVAWKTGDVDTYLYGPAAVLYQTKQRIKQHADGEIRRLQTKIQQAREQLAMPFYRARV